MNGHVTDEDEIRELREQQVCEASDEVEPHDEEARWGAIVASASQES